MKSNNSVVINPKLNNKHSIKTLKRRTFSRIIHMITPNKFNIIFLKYRILNRNNNNQNSIHQGYTSQGNTHQDNIHQDNIHQQGVTKKRNQFSRILFLMQTKILSLKLINLLKVLKRQSLQKEEVVYLYLKQLTRLKRHLNRYTWNKEEQ